MKTVFIVLLAILFSPNTSIAKIDVLLPGLEKSGSGTIRYMGIFKVYDAELYTRPGLQPDTLLDADTSKCLVLRYDLNLSAEDIIKGANAVLTRQNSKEDLAKTSQYIEVLHNNYTNVHSGDSYALCYDSPSSTTKLFFNGAEVVSISSAEFARLYFGIWLGNKEPISESLRDDLLAQLKVTE